MLLLCTKKYYCTRGQAGAFKCLERHFGRSFHTCISFSFLFTDDLIDELPVEKRHLSKLIIICWIKLTGD